MHPLLTGLVDDAATFPPGNLPMPHAVAAHREHRRAPYAGLVGRFVVAASRLDELAAVLSPREPLEVNLVVDTDIGTASAAIDRVADDPRLDLKAIEVPLPDGDLADTARRAVDVLPDVQAYVEVPLVPAWLDALRVVADSPYGVKLRTGGDTATAFPTEVELAAFIVRCVALEVPFKLTAGLHSAVRHRDPRTGFEHHGFVNALLATSAAIDGGGAGEVAAVLAQPDAGALVERVASLGPAAAAVTRSFFVAFGSCSIDEPVNDLRVLGLLE